MPQGHFKSSTPVSKATAILTLAINSGLLEIVWRNFQRVAVETPLPQGFGEFSEAQKLGMNWRWEECGGW
jgi:hypothetical protein